MDPGSLVAIVIAVIAALASWASAKASSNASVKNSESSGRVEMEKEAYERARKLDIETITRQDNEIEEFRAENKALREQIKQLSDRVDHLEKELRTHQREEGSYYDGTV